MQYFQQVTLPIVLVLLAAVVTSVFGQSSRVAQDDLTLTQRQIQALEKFKSRVIPYLPHKYMRHDSYLVNWLRAKNFNINEAEKFLKENLKWRKANKIDRVQEEDFSDMLEQYPVYVDTYDKNGAPVITAVAGHWNLRRAMITGQATRLHRFLYKIMDEASIKVREAQLQGKNVTRFHFLLNLDGFNMVQHGCPRCVVEIVAFVQGYEKYFPGMTDKNVVFNAPPAVQPLVPIVQGVMSSQTMGHTVVIGTNRKEWRNYFLKFIDEDQLTEDFGGTRVRDE